MVTQRGSTVVWETVGKIWETVSVAQNAFKKHWYWAQHSGKPVLSFDSIDTVNTAWLLELSLFIDVAATWRLLHPALRSAAQSRDNHLSDNKTPVHAVLSNYACSNANKVFNALTSAIMRMRITCYSTSGRHSQPDTVGDCHFLLV